MFESCGGHQITLKKAQPFSPVSSFTDKRPNRYQSPKLPFGGAAIPEAGFSYQLLPSEKSDPSGTKIRVKYQWAELE
jgi:immune inhibitor A